MLHVGIKIHIHMKGKKVSTLSAPVKPGIAMQKDIFRFAATLFSESYEGFSSEESQLQMIKCIYVNNSNKPLSISEIALQLYEVFFYHISEDEVLRAIKKHKKTFQIVNIDEEECYQLLETTYHETVDLQKNNIDTYIAQFIQQNNISDVELCVDAIHRYLYELTTTNINSYKILLYGKSETKYSESELSVNLCDISEKEEHYVHDFIEWNNAEKNIALTNIVFACLEYCMLVNGDKPSQILANTIRKRDIFLDTNIIFRAIGINGQARQHTVITFLKKCKQANLKLFITHQTKQEFENTIHYYITQILSYPRGDVYPEAYEELSYYNMFSYYEYWKNEHPNLSIRFFKLYITSQYDQLVREYSIKDNHIIPDELYNSEEFKKTRNKYSSEIQQKKQDAKSVYLSDDYLYNKRDSHDATVISYIEKLRENEKGVIDVFFVSSDKVLRYWDMNRDEGAYPIVIYPSQLFLALIKMCGRSENDFESFVKFINIPSQRNQITAEKANVILAGISSITEDIGSQKMLVSSICSGEYQNIIQRIDENDKLYQAIQAECKKYLDAELKEKERAISQLTDDVEKGEKAIRSLQQSQEQQQDEIESLKQKIVCDESKLSNAREESEKQKEKLCVYAEKKIRCRYVFKWYVLPIVTIILTITYVAFIALQFVFCEAPWNFVTQLMNNVATTTFGKNVEEYVLPINAAIFAVLSGVVFPVLWSKPWDYTKKSEDKQKRIEEYLQKNKLL